MTTTTTTTRAALLARLDTRVDRLRYRIVQRRGTQGADWLREARAELLRAMYERDRLIREEGEDEGIDV
jgi:hypothetical protein